MLVFLLSKVAGTHWSTFQNSSGQVYLGMLIHFR